MHVILFCDTPVRFLPLREMPEARLPYCNTPLIVHILRFLDQSGIPDVTLIGADAETRELVNALSLSAHLHYADAAEALRLSAPTLLLRRLSLPRWDMGELLALCDAAPVRLVHPDGSPTGAELHPMGSIPAVPDAAVTAVLSVFRLPSAPSDYLAQQQELLHAPHGKSRRIGEGVRIGRNAVISESSVIGSDCVIGSRAVIEDCVLGDGVQIGADAVLRRCVICRHALIDRGVQCSDLTAAEGEIVAAHRNAPMPRRFQVSAQDGIHEGLPRWNTAETALCAGAAMTALGDRIAVGCDSPAAVPAVQAAAAGAASQGAQVWNAGCCALSQLIYAAKQTECTALLWLQGEEVLYLRPYGAAGLELTDAQRSRLRQALRARTARHILPAGSLADARPLLQLWETKCRALFHNPECTVEICCGSPPLRETAQRLFGGGRGERIVLNLTDDGRQASVFSQDIGMIRHEQLLLLSLLSFREEGAALALPEDFHPAAEAFASRMGGRILRLYAPSVSPTAARLFAEQGVCTDGVLLFAHILRIMECRRMRLPQLAALLPPMYTLQHEFSTPLTPQAVERLRRSDPDRAVRVGLPAANGRLRLLIHAHSAETAAELCSGWEKKFRAAEESY